jgi:hypothetical protein
VTSEAWESDSQQFERFSLLNRRDAAHLRSERDSKEGQKRIEDAHLAADNTAGHDECANSAVHSGVFMAEIRVAPVRRNRAMVWMIVVALVVAAVVAWYFLAGPGAGA